MMRLAAWPRSPHGRRPVAWPAVSPSSLAEDRAEVSLHWLVRLRWGAVAASLLVVVVAQAVFGADLPMVPVLALLGVTAVTNLAARLPAVARRPGAARRFCGAALVVDALVLTALLRLTGGPSNPFSVLYLVYIDLAAVTLGAAWTWSLAALSAACYGSLFLPPPAAHAHGVGDAAFLRHLQAMWFAFTMAAGLTAYFVVRLAAALERRDAELAAVREQATRNERLASLTTLAAGAAHELGTPLATIAVAAKELEHALDGLDGSGLADDARLIRGQVERCRRILDDMASGAGEPAGESPEPVGLRELAEAVLGELLQHEARRVRVMAPADGSGAVLPRRALVRAVTCLVRNALDASGAEQPVTLMLRPAPPLLEIEVQDEGRGMTPEVLAHAVEPFFSTKPAGRGLGLGLFLVQTLAERMGGRLLLRSMPGSGATATLELPLAETA